VWAEQLKAQAPEAQVLMRYGKSNGWLDDQPAVITRPYGQGRVTYIGGILDEKLMASAADWMVKDSEVTAAFGTVPPGVEVSRRVGAGKQVFILINYSPEVQKIMLPRAMKSLLQDKQTEAVELPVYGVALLLDRN